MRHLQEERQPLRVRMDDPGAWFHGDAEDRERLDALSARLLLPLAVKDELRGFLVLGPKLSEAAYSPSDMRLLRWWRPRPPSPWKTASSRRPSRRRWPSGPA